MNKYKFEKKETAMVCGRKRNIYQVWDVTEDANFFVAEVSGRNKIEAKENFYDIGYGKDENEDEDED